MNTPTPNFCRVIAELDTLGYNTDPIVDWVFHEDSLFRRNRQQLISVLPMLAVALSSLPESTLLMEVEAIIDRGDKLIDALARVVGVRRRSVRCLIRKYPTELGNYWMDNPIELLRAIDLLIPEKIPTRQLEWSLMQHFWEGCGLSSNPQYSRVFPCVGKPDQAREHLFSGLCLAGYTHSEKRLARAFNNQIDRLRDVGDYFDFVAQWCGSGHWVNSKNLYIRNRLIRNLAGKLLTRYSAHELINQSKRWHQLANRLPIPSVEHEDDAAGYQWLGLPGLPWQHEDLTIVSLTNGAELSLEGNLMNHCVGSYFDDCRRGDAHIVSIRDESGNRLSTAEISLEQVGDQIRTTVVQHRAEGNSLPEGHCEIALRTMLERWESEDNQRELASLLHLCAVQRERIELMLSEEADSCSEHLNDLMQEVLPDYDKAVSFLGSNSRRATKGLKTRLE